MNHFLLPPDSTFDNLSAQIWHQVYLDIFAERNLRHFNTFIEHRNFAIPIDYARISETKDIFERNVWLG